MKKLFRPVFLIVLMLIFATGANAGKPADEQGVFIGNGFPSGPHFNLNVIAKKAEFTCPNQELLCPDGYNHVTDCSSCPSTGICTPLYGGTIFVPQTPGLDPITILMESGAKGPKGNPGATSLEVTDWCTETFDGGPASFRLPANAEGYAVYARVTGDPKQNPQFSFTNPRFKYVMDEYGNDLWLLGFVTNSVFDSTGIALPSRYDSTGKGKGVQKGVNITPLFLWSGDVCYLEQNDLVDYCGWVDSNSSGTVDIGDTINCALKNYCCLDIDGDGYYEYCPPQPIDGCSSLTLTTAPLCCFDTDSESPGYEYCQLSPGTCTASTLESGPFVYQTITAWCKTYGSATSGEWVFNIADFVGLLFDIQNTSDNPSSGSSVIQIRFYPLPLNTL